MSSVQDAFKYNKARKNVIIGGIVILICITALICISSFMIYRSGFGDMPFIFQQALCVRSATRLDRWKSTKIIKHYYRTDTENACGDDTDAVRSAWSAGIACGDEERSRQVGAVQIHAFSDDR